MIDTQILMPVFALICWTTVIFFWLFALRMPAMGKAQVDPQQVKHPAALKGLLPSNVEAVGDNYNHLMEQPTVFYALCFYLALTGHADALAVQLAWGYVGLRVVHSLIQNTANHVTSRFLVFAIASLLMITIVIRELLSLLG